MKATPEHIEPDAWLARDYFHRAIDFLSDGAEASLSNASRQVLLHNAALAACDAVLAINGRAVTGSDGGHVLRLETTERLLGDGLDDLFERLDDARVTRANASYQAGQVADGEPDVAAQAVRELVELAREHISRGMPDHFTLPSPRGG